MSKKQFFEQGGRGKNSNELKITVIQVEQLSLSLSLVKQKCFDKTLRT